ncbi:hypothetical protein DERF_004696 [Dermatophagoides farinae]|uniref:Uncharacterized protein n=1 Tax=Dermatophagoides farinae TaxID=6954 RepID=A0A922L5T8_DERFA|nr:hypothetical protein DERF_004696 [Dermatophagoides farinae]
MKVKLRDFGRSSGSPTLFIGNQAKLERIRWYPKDGELCLGKTKPEETLVEVCSDSDVQIDRQTWDSRRFLTQSHPVKLMIRGLGVETTSTYSQTLNGRAAMIALKVSDVGLPGAVIGADLGGSSKYSTVGHDSVGPKEAVKTVTTARF